MSQKLNYGGCLVHPLFGDILALYEAVSDDPVKDFDGVSQLSPLMSVLQKGASFNCSYYERGESSIQREKTNNVVVCFSGGKDSVALALHLKSQGKNVYLYHVKGINRSYTDEHERAAKLAGMLGLPLFIDEVSLSGKNAYKESPVKNQILVTLALNYALNNDLGVDVALGDFTEDTLAISVFDRNWSDATEMWEAYREVMKSVVPNFELHIVFKTYLETLEVLSRNRDLLVAVQGCMAPKRFRDHWRVHNSKRYSCGDELLPNRCGSCWKCCTEYLFMADKGVVKYNMEFYRHCLDLLSRKIPEEHPYFTGDKTYENVYKLYLKNAPVPERVKVLD